MNRPPGVGACPSEFSLERLRHGELNGSEAGQAVSHHVAHCASCTTRLAGFAAAPPPFALDAVWRTALATGQLQGRPPARPTAGFRWPAFVRRLALGSAFTVAAVTAALALRLQPAPPTDLIKGAAWGLTVIAKTRTARDAVPIASGTRLVAGDRLRFQVATTWPVGYVAIISLDSTGAVSPLVPTEGDTVQVRAGRPTLLDGAVELDDAKGPERIELVGCPRPMAAAQLVAVASATLARAGGDLHKMGPIASGCYHATFWIEKATP